MICRAKSHLIGLCTGLIAVWLTTTVANAGWQLTFSDEFDGDTLDLMKWKVSDIWNNGTLANNGEQQCYVPEGVEQSGGVLRLTAQRLATPAANCKGANFDLGYISGMLTTSGCNQYETSDYCKKFTPFAQAYGYFEVRAKLPKGKGFWPAFWLAPMDLVWPPEIDVMEALGHTPTTVHQTYHFKDAAGAHKQNGKAYKGADFTSKFSTFGLDWRPGLLIWYVDGKETFRISGPEVTSKSMYLQLNLAVGGHWPGNPDQATPFPSSMIVDYVRVYKRVDDGTPDDVPPGHAPRQP